MARILIIDDSPTDRAAIGAWVREMGHEFMEANDAEAGIRSAQERRPDLILMDVVMPGRNGFEATRMLRRDERTQSIPVVIISSKNQPTDIAWGKRQGAAGYLPKPFGKQALGQALADAGLGG